MSSSVFGDATIQYDTFHWIYHTCRFHTDCDPHPSINGKGIHCQQSQTELSNSPPTPQVVQATFEQHPPPEPRGPPMWPARACCMGMDRCPRRSWGMRVHGLAQCARYPSSAPQTARHVCFFGVAIPRLEGKRHVRKDICHAGAARR